METPRQQGRPDEGTALTSFDHATADAVVAVLSSAGIPVWQDDALDEYGDVVVRVAAGQRDRAMREMGLRMEEIQAAVRRSARGRDGAAPPGEDSPATAPRDPDDVRQGPPLTMERFADLRLVVVVVLAPLLAVTIAGPFLPRALSRVIFAVLLTVVALVVWRRRRR